MDGSQSNTKMTKKSFSEPINLQETLAFLFWHKWSEQDFNKSPAADTPEGSELMGKAANAAALRKHPDNL